MLSQLKAGLLKLLYPLIAAVMGGRRRVFVARGIRMLIDVGESPMMLARALGLYELRKAAEIRRRLRPGGVFVDVGANQGDFTLLAASLVGPAGRVVAFEPDPDNVAALRENLRLNGFANVEVRAVALADEAGSATLHRSAISGWHSLNEGGNTGGRPPITVALERLDDLGLTRLDVLKIDVEGAENAVIRGAMNTLHRCRPVVLLDTHPMLGADIPALDAIFLALGYATWESDRTASVRRDGPWPSTPADLVLIPGDRE